MADLDKQAGGQPRTPAIANGGGLGLRAGGRVLLSLAAFVVVVAGMKAASGILVPFLLAVFIAVIVAPLFLGMQERGVPTAIAILFMVLLLAVVGVAVISVFEQALSGLTGNLARYQTGLGVQLEELWLWLADHGIEAPVDQLKAALNPQWLLGHLGAIASTLRDALMTTFIVVLVAIFILLEAAALPAKIRTMPGLTRGTWARIVRIVADVRRYMFLKTLMSLLTGALVFVWLWLLGVDSAFLMGVLAFALNYIPNIGSIVAAVPGVLLALIEYGLGSAAITGIGYVVINVGVSNGIEPRFMGYGLGLSPLVVLSSVIFWGWVLGPMGMLLSIPLTMTLKIALESNDDTRWMAWLMGSRPRRQRRAFAGTAAKPPATASEGTPGTAVAGSSPEAVAGPPADPAMPKAPAEVA